jgi:uncharacterized protein YdeI (YjbR/CyaY-like superfamily)
MPDDDAAALTFATVDELERWFEARHDEAPELWIKMAKKASGIPSVTHAEALDVALCFGWIDAVRRPCDERFFLQRWTPRRARSSWSKVNCAKVEVLAAAGRMRPAGLAEVERAKADGRWERAYDGARTATVPPDFQAALDANPAARDFFATLGGSKRYSFLYRIQDAKRPGTRARRIEQYVALLAEQRTLT